MDSKIVFVALVLIATFALPTLATFEKDFITTEAVRAILKKTNANVMPSEDVINALTGKTVISNVVLEETLVMKLDNGLTGIPCGESCVYLPCFTAPLGCSCSSKVCYRNSLHM
uniref:Cyclotide 1 n=1 Tax=Viola baoshanensis TaxID=349688 RepID=Q09PG2_9ROSI|nr:cyclotide precursor 1 [Viola baoshanensis]ACG69842.1 cyclotide precursor 1b [Viola baoshanensis]